MRKLIVFWMIIGIMGNSFIRAEEPVAEEKSSTQPKGMEERISLDLRNIEVIDALKFLSMKAGINIIATKNVSGRVTLMVENVPVKDVFDIMLRSNGLAYAKKGEIYNVMTEEEYKALFGRKFADERQVKTFRLQYAIPEQAFVLLDTLKSDIGRIFVEPDSGTVIIMDTPEKLSLMEKALFTLEQKNLIQVFQLKYAKAKDVEEQLKLHLDLKKVGLVKADERSNQVIVQTLPERMPDIENLINALDKKTKVVLIDAKIIKIKLSDKLEEGVEWEGIFDVARKYGLTYVGSYPFSVLKPGTEPWQSRKDFLDSIGGQVGAYPFSGNTSSVSASTKVAPGEKMHVGIVDSKRDFDVLIKYLQSLGKTQILSNPKLVVVNNQEAKIHVGERQAYVTSTITKGQTTDTVSEEVTFVDVGIQLSVTPTINEEGYITMKVRPEVSSVVSTLVTSLGNKIPIIDTSTAETTVMVKDGSTIIIGGLRKEEKTSSSKQVPILGSIPLVGLLFKSATNQNERTELLVMLTPHILTGDVLTTGEERPSELKVSKEFSIEEKARERPIEKKEEVGKELERGIKPYREYTPLNEDIEE